MSSLYELVLRPSAINFAPENEAEEILQNVKTLCSTIKYSVPMDRALGIDGALIDEPVNAVRGKYIQEVVKAVKEYEPRARISKVDFTADTDVEIYTKLFVEIIG